MLFSSFSVVVDIVNFARISCKVNLRSKILFGNLTLLTRQSSSSPIVKMDGNHSYKRWDNIVKSEQDKREYRGLMLKNEMKILLISDPSTDKSAAAMEVNVGHMCDPHDLPGLAHFCEHMLFLGTEKYPVENEYPRFLSEHGGSSNAFTASDHTNYYFDVVPLQLSAALDRFAQFFLTPLFTESATDREVNAVDSEHVKNIPSDAWRLSQLDKSTSNPNHPYSKFGTGNKDTLDTIPKERGIQVREELLKFHKKWYSANLMSLVVLGQESLDELEKLCVGLFSEVENKNVESPEWKEHPFGPENLQVKGLVVPVKDIRNLNITFPVPDMREHYETQPERYLSHLIGHEGPGSLLSELKSRGWVNSLMAGESSGAKGFAFFGINVDLTEDGIEHVDDIVTLAFQYLNMLRKLEPQKWVFDELEGLSRVQFRFKDKEKPQSYVCSLASKLQYYPMEEVISGDYSFKEWKPDLVTSVLDMLTPENIRIAVIGKKFESVADSKEVWYGTSYKLEKIDSKDIEAWKNAGLSEKLHMPHRNEFIPEKLDLVAREEPQPWPIILKNSQLSRVWFKQDTEFLLPKAVVYIEMFSPIAYLDPLRCSQVCLLASLFHDALNEFTYAAEVAGLGYALQSTKYGLQLSLKGYNDKLPTLLQKLIEKLTTFTVDPQRFRILKESYVRALQNFRAEQPYQHATYHTNMLLAERAWSKTDLLNSTDDLTVESLQSFIPFLFSQLHLEFLFHGNLTKQQAMDMVDTVESGLKTHFATKPLLPCQLIRDREVQMNNGANFLYCADNDVHATHCVETYLQLGLEDKRSNMLLELAMQILKEPCFNVLRTQEQLGYIVFSGVRRAHGVQGLRFIVQSEKPPTYVDGRIEAFLHSMEQTLKDMSAEEYERHKTALAVRRQEKPKQLSHRAVRYWSEITTGQYFFDRDDMEVEELMQITHQELLDFFASYVFHQSPLRRKMAVHILASNVSQEKAEPVVHTNGGVTLSQPPPQIRETELVEDVAAFKKSMPLFPLATPIDKNSVLAASAKAKL